MLLSNLQTTHAQPCHACCWWQAVLLWLWLHHRPCRHALLPWPPSRRCCGGRWLWSRLDLDLAPSVASPPVRAHAGPVHTGASHASAATGKCLGACCCPDCSREPSKKDQRLTSAAPTKQERSKPSIARKLQSAQARAVTANTPIGCWAVPTAKVQSIGGVVWRATWPGLASRQPRL